MPVRDKNEGGRKDHYLEDQGIISKEFGEPIVALNGTNATYTWTNR